MYHHISTNVNTHQKIIWMLLELPTTNRRLTAGFSQGSGGVQQGDRAGFAFKRYEY
jgi:hypothetical protein